MLNHQAKIIGYRAANFLLTYRKRLLNKCHPDPASFILHESCLDTRSNHRIQLCLPSHTSCRLVNETGPERIERIESYVSAIATEGEIDITSSTPSASLFLSIYVRSPIRDVHMRQRVQLLLCVSSFSARGGRAESCKAGKRRERVGKFNLRRTPDLTREDDDATLLK